MAAEKDRVPLRTEASHAPMPAGAIFLSYASEDAAAAQQITTALRNAGIEVWFDNRVRRGQLERRFAALTKREREVLTHLVHGKNMKQIAVTLGVGERVIKLHRQSINSKLGVHSVAEITTLAHQVGLFSKGQNSLALSGLADSGPIGNASIPTAVIDSGRPFERGPPRHS